MLKPFLKYAVRRGVALFLTVVVAVYIVILIANLGGYVDEMIKSDIYLKISDSVRNNPAYKNYSPEQIKKVIDELARIEIERMGFDKPFIYRSFIYLWNGLTLNLGRSYRLVSNSGSSNVRTILLERIPVTMLLFTTANLILFFVSLFVGLVLSRHYGSLFDKIVVYLSPLSSIPAWFYGIFLILIFASLLRILPYGGLVDIPPPENSFNYFLSMLVHLILPVGSYLLAYSFIGIYNRRTYFLIFSNENYVEMAKAKGLPPRVIERKYILRPTLPAIVTDFALMLISCWMGSIVTERVFSWPGLGTLFYQAISLSDAPVIIGEVVIYAYLLAITVFVLDLVYAILDPRIRLGKGER